MSYQKLVRDKIPEIIANNGEQPITRILSDKEYILEIKRKLKEEAEEVILANKEERLEELADLLEVMIAIANIDGRELSDIINVCNKKREERGGFSRKLFLEGVRDDK